MSNPIAELIDARATLVSDAFEHVYGTVVSYAPSARLAMVDIGASGVTEPVKIPAFPFPVRPGQQLLIERRRGATAGGVPVALVVFGEPLAAVSQLDYPTSPDGVADYLARIKRASQADYSLAAELGLDATDQPFLRFGDVLARRTGAKSVAVDDGAEGAVAVNVVGSLALNGAELAAPPVSPGLRFVPILPAYILNGRTDTADTGQLWTNAVSSLGVPAGTRYVQASAVSHCTVADAIIVVELYHASQLGVSAIVSYTAAAKGSYGANTGIIELGSGANDQKIAYSIHCGTWGGATATSYVRVSGYLAPAA